MFCSLRAVDPPEDMDQGAQLYQTGESPAADGAGLGHDHGPFQCALRGASAATRDIHGGPARPPQTIMPLGMERRQLLQAPACGPKHARLQGGTPELRPKAQHPAEASP
jgi:hypothetical protein